MSSISSHDQKRRKIERACDACRRKKTKCDGPKMPDNVCSNCIQNRKDCTYLEASKPRGPPKAYVTGLEDRLERMEALLSKLRPEIDFSIELGPPVVRGSWRDDHPSNAKAAAKKPSQHPSQSVLRRSYSQSSTATTPLTAAPATNSIFLDLRPWPVVDRGFSLPQTPIGLSTHLLSKRRPRVRTRPKPGVSKSKFSPEADVEYSSSSDVDDTAELSVTRGIKRLTLRGLESIDDPEPEVSADSQMRFHGKSSLLELITEARKLKGIHESKVRRAEHGVTQLHPDISLRSKNTETPLRRPEFWTTPPWELAWEGLHRDPSDLLASLNKGFPPPDLAVELFELYFMHINLHFPLLHRPTFERQWRDGLHQRDHWFACLCMAMFAAASRWCEDDRILEGSAPTFPFAEANTNDSPGPRNWHHAGWKWFKAAFDVHMLRRSFLHPPCLFEVQTIPLLCMFLKGTKEFQSFGWLLISIGIKKAQDVGAHRRKIYGSRPTVEEELWKRVFWILVGYDRVVSVSLGRSCCVGEEDFDVDLPLEVDDEYWEADDPAMAFRQPPGKPSLVAAFNSWIHLTQILAFALRTLYAIDKSKALLGIVAPQWKQEVVTQLDTAMTDWWNTVPEHLKWSEHMDNPVFANQSSSIYTTYYLNHILIFRPFIPSTTKSPPSPFTSLSYPSFPYPALAICVNAAKMCARIIQVRLSLPSGVSNTPSFIACAHICAAVLMMKVWDIKGRAKVKLEDGVDAADEDMKPPAGQTVEELLADVDVCITALEWASRRWEKAAHHLQGLKASLPNSDSGSGPPQPSSFPPRGRAQKQRSYERHPPAPEPPVTSSSSSYMSSSSHRSTPESPVQVASTPTVQAQTGWQSYPAFQPISYPYPYPQPAYPMTLAPHPPYYPADSAPGYWYKQSEPPRPQPQPQPRARTPTPDVTDSMPGRALYLPAPDEWTPRERNRAVRMSWPSVSSPPTVGEHPLPSISLTRRMSLSMARGEREREPQPRLHGCNELETRPTAYLPAPEAALEHRWGMDRMESFERVYTPRQGESPFPSTFVPPGLPRGEYPPGPSYTPGHTRDHEYDPSFPN